MILLSRCLLVMLFSLGLPGLGLGYVEPDWRAGTGIAPSGRANIYDLSAAELEQATDLGKVHAMNYPVTVTGLLLPYDGFNRLFAQQDNSWLQKLLQRIFGGQLGFSSIDDIEAWLGLYRYPENHSKLASVESIPLSLLGDANRQRRMGSSLIDAAGAPGLTYSCGACHVGQLFGEKVIGMPTRFPRANLAFKLGKTAMGLVPNAVLNRLFRSSEAERALLGQLDRNIKATGGRYPQVLGLDTSLAHVALSLAHRNIDDYASKSSDFERRPRRDPLKSKAADSKPGTWWLLKYKNRWLSDGSILSGNPIFTNILWNEIGRGTDLYDLEEWLELNEEKIQQLTAAVFANQAPRFTDFFPAESIDLEAAKLGHQLFHKNCHRCHGSYDKAWQQDDVTDATALSELLKTTKVTYFSQTPVYDVGTDPLRAEGMTSLEQLNDLAISKNFGTVVRAGRGYVPPPLVGIWARWPYFHNNAAPSLCAVLTRSKDRPQRYLPREANDRDHDFDMNCNGYPAATRNLLQASQKTFDSRRPGLSNRGHDEGIFLRDGEEIYSAVEKMAIIQFLQTL